MVGAICNIIQTFRAYMMVVLATHIRMAEAIVETGTFKNVGVLMPYIQIVVATGILCIKYRYTVFPNAHMPEAYSGRRACVRCRIAGNLVDKILIRRNVWVSHPRANGVARNAGSAYIYISGCVLHQLHITYYAPIAGGSSIAHPGCDFRTYLGHTAACDKKNSPQRKNKFPVHK
jgi:hypothetical protein